MSNVYNVLFGAWISSSFSNTKVRYLKYELYFRHPLLLLLDINRSTIEYSDDTVDSSQYSSLGQLSRSCCCIINQHNCPHPTTTTQKTEWSDPIITWDIRVEIVHIVRPHHLIVILHFDIFICCCSFAVDTGTYLSPHKPNMTAVLFVQFTSQTNTQICPTHTHAPNHKNTSPLLSPSHIHWHTMHKFLVTNKGLLLHN